MKNNKGFDFLVRALSASFLVCTFFICKNTTLLPFSTNINTNDILAKNFVVFNTRADTFLDEVKHLALKRETAKEKEVFNPEVIPNEEESETQSPEPVYEEQVKYYNSGDFISYDSVLIKNHTQKEIDVQKLMKDYKPPEKKEKPQILIIHTHATEGFSDQPTSRTTDNEKNVVKVGTYLEEVLEKKGFNVLHDIKLHDYPNYNGSYVNALKTAEWYMEHYSGIEIILDVHRDAIVTESGARTKLTFNHGGQKAAQLMLVVGTDEGGLKHPAWQENLKFAIGLQAEANSMYDGLMRPIDLRKERFNEHVTKNSLIIEFGTNGNSLEEALKSAQLLSEVLDKYIT
ncbi:MAG: stage II sporulation protein P [Clostridia bacterium]|nr:stage II sporulation protein P [Clostridia bacterium]